MKRYILTVLFVFAVSFSLSSQIKINEGFETSDSTVLPAGWSVVNNAAFQIDPFGNWTVRDSGRYLPGLSTTRAKAHSGIKSIAVTWYAGVDSSLGSYGTSDAWLVTKKITGITSNDILKFWACGGSSTYWDSLQIWVSLVDSLPYSFFDKLGTIIYPNGSIPGNYQSYTYSLASFASQQYLYIGFRYYMDCTTDGYTVFLDDVYVGPPVSVQQIGTNIPGSFKLYQNYPNPFNPVTTIKFDVAKLEQVKITVYNTLGVEVKTLMNEKKAPGTYEMKLEASDMPSGVYFYTLQTQSYNETKKLVVLK